MSTRQRGLHALKAGVSIAIVAGALCGCTSPTTASTSPVASTSAKPTATAALQVPTPAPSRLPAPTPAPTLPSGNWTGIHWTHVQTTAAVWMTPAGLGPISNGNVTESGWTVFGWDDGYVAFDVITTKSKNGSKVTVIDTEHSTDGITWSAGGSFTPPSFTPDWPDQQSPSVGGVEEGPAGLLVYDYYDCVCECHFPTIHPLGASTDGVTWQTVQGAVVGDWLDAGSAGYIVPEGNQVEISNDGITWTGTRLSGKAFAMVDSIDSGASFAGGFVITSETYGPLTKGRMCIQFPIPMSPTVWFSADGKTWARQILPGGNIGEGDGSAQVCHVNDHLLLAEEWDGLGSLLQWTSSNGTTWTSASTDVSCDDTQGYGGLVPFAGHYLYQYFDPSGNWILETLGPDLQYESLVETGDEPDWQDVWHDAYGAANLESDWALGAAGLIVSDGHGNLWVGVLTSG